MNNYFFNPALGLNNQNPQNPWSFFTGQQGNGNSWQVPFMQPEQFAKFDILGMLESWIDTYSPLLEALFTNTTENTEALSNVVNTWISQVRDAANFSNGNLSQLLQGNPFAGFAQSYNFFGAQNPQFMQAGIENALQYWENILLDAAQKVSVIPTVGPYREKIESLAALLPLQQNARSEQRKFFTLLLQVFLKSLDSFQNKLLEHIQLKKSLDPASILKLWVEVADTDYSAFTLGDTFINAFTSFSASQAKYRNALLAARDDMLHSMELPSKTNLNEISVTMHGQHRKIRDLHEKIGLLHGQINELQKTVGEIAAAHKKNTTLAVDKVDKTVPSDSSGQITFAATAATTVGKSKKPVNEKAGTQSNKKS